MSVTVDGMTQTKVSADNFARAETHRMMAGLQRDAGGVNQFSHNREPAPVDKQTVIRMNRDTLYSFAVVDISEGAILTVPDAGERYLSVMVVNEDHYINQVFHDPGRYELTVEEFDTPYVVIAARSLVDPADPDDLAAVAAVQDGFALESASGRTFEMPDYDTESLDSTRTALLGLAAGMNAFSKMFGRREDVDPVRHLIGTAAGWGGLPDVEATYVGVFPDLPGRHVRPHRRRRPGRRVLVDLGLQRRRLLRAQRAGRLQRQQHHRRPERRRQRHRPLRRRRRQRAAHHRGMELHRPPVPSAPRDPRPATGPSPLSPRRRGCRSAPRGTTPHRVSP